jgi:hypothetical protein
MFKLFHCIIFCLKNILSFLIEFIFPIKKLNLMYDFNIFSYFLVFISILEVRHGIFQIMNENILQIVCFFIILCQLHTLRTMR